MSRDSAVGIATGYGAGLRTGRSSSSGGGKNFHFSMSSRPALRPTQPHIQCVPGTLSSEVKRLVRKADHSQTSAEIKKTWVYTFIPPYAFMA
jgi:hypothetical protein